MSDIMRIVGEFIGLSPFDWARANSKVGISESHLHKFVIIILCCFVTSLESSSIVGYIFFVYYLLTAESL